MVTLRGTHLSKEDKEWLKTMSKEQLFINYREQKRITDELREQVKKLNIDDVSKSFCDNCKSGLIDYPEINRRTCQCGALRYNVC